MQKKIHNRINKLFSEGNNVRKPMFEARGRRQGLIHINKEKLYEIEWCSHDILLWPNPEVESLWFPWQKDWDYWIGFWIIAENNLYNKHKFMMPTPFGQQDDLHRWTPLLWF